MLWSEAVERSSLAWIVRGSAEPVTLYPSQPVEEIGVDGSGTPIVVWQGIRGGTNMCTPLAISHHMHVL